MGMIAPLYFFLSYVFSAAPNTRPGTVPRHKLIAVTVAVVLSHLVPAYGMLFWGYLLERQEWAFVWQLYPIYTSIVFHGVSGLLGRTMACDTTTPVDRARLVTRLCIGSVALCGMAVWVCTAWSNTHDLIAIFIPSSFPLWSLPDFSAFCREFLRWDELLMFTSAFTWSAYSYADLRRWEMTRVSLPLLLLCAVITVLIGGPGAALGLMWLLREEIILERGREAVYRGRQ